MTIVVETDCPRCKGLAVASFTAEMKQTSPFECDSCGWNDDFVEEEDEK